MRGPVCCKGPLILYDFRVLKFQNKSPFVVTVTIVYLVFDSESNDYNFGSLTPLDGEKKKLIRNLWSYKFHVRRSDFDVLCKNWAVMCQSVFSNFFSPQENQKLDQFILDGPLLGRFYVDDRRRLDLESWVGMGLDFEIRSDFWMRLENGKIPTESGTEFRL